MSMHFQSASDLNADHSSLQMGRDVCLRSIALTSDGVLVEIGFACPGFSNLLLGVVEECTSLGGCHERVYSRMPSPVM